MSDEALSICFEKIFGYLHLQVLIDVLRSERDFCVGYTMLLYIPGKRAGFFCLFVGEGTEGGPRGF
jgi:hypothetical protein